MARGAFEKELLEIDRRIVSTPEDQLPELLGGLPIDLFGGLLLDTPPWLPNLRSFLPSMPPDEIQITWTGAAGMQLLQQSIAHYRAVRAHVAVLTGMDWSKATIADYGCGWGRITRLFAQHVPIGNIYALDPWDRSIDLCREHRVRGHLLECDYVPSELPVGEVLFDFVNCFSVFTHLSEKCHRQVLSVIRKYVKDDALVAVTIRPPEYWDIHQAYPDGCTSETMKSRYRELGYAFIPHNREPIDGDVTYGDASISLEYIRAEWTEWAVALVDFSLLDPYQLTVYLRPR